MAINFKCKCGQVLTAEDEHAGMQAKCPQCGKLITIPPPEREESKCPECGKPMEPDAVICMECGFNISFFIFFLSSEASYISGSSIPALLTSCGLPQEDRTIMLSGPISPKRGQK